MALGLESVEQVGGESWGKDGAWKNLLENRKLSSPIVVVSSKRAGF